jgi:prevent-host-death family protein
VKTLPLAEVKANLTQLIDQVVKHDEPILITRNGRPAAVLVSANEYDSLCETAAIRSDRELMAEIRQSLRGLKRGATTRGLTGTITPGGGLSRVSLFGEGPPWPG